MPKYLTVWSLQKMKLKFLDILENCFDWVPNDKGLAKYWQYDYMGLYPM